MILGINYLRSVPGAVLDMGMSIRLNNPYFFFALDRNPAFRKEFSHTWFVPQRCLLTV